MLRGQLHSAIGDWRLVIGDGDGDGDGDWGYGMQIGILTWECDLRANARASQASVVDQCPGVSLRITRCCVTHCALCVETRVLSTQHSNP